MSVQKLVSEAEKLLEKGKSQEAIAKLEQALSQEPINQLVATKLANIHIENQDTAAAVKIYVKLGNNLSEAGKSQIAVPIFKKALELNPNDINLRLRFAQECESVGKLGDAYLQGQTVLQHFLRRKRFFDAAGLLPLLVRAQPRDEKLKVLWVEVMQYSQADQKLHHLLVALCGPPGLVSQEFSVGGEPTAVSEAVYERLKRLVPFFPRDPKLAYAVAWTALKQGRKRDFYHYLRESLRRNPDFTLSLLLLARVLAEDQKLNEALFVYKHLKERVPADKSVDLLTLNQLVESFVEKNGWINFSDGFGGSSSDALDPANFLRLVRGESAVAPAPEENNSSSESAAPAESEQDRSAPREATGPVAPLPVPQKEKTKTGLTAPPAEIELSPPSVALGAAQDMEIEFTSVSAQDAMKKLSATGAIPAPAPTPVAPPVLTPAPAAAEALSGASGLPRESVEFTSLVKMDASAPITSSAEPAPSREVPLPTPEPAVPPAAEKTPAAKKYFNPFEGSAPPAASSQVPSAASSEGVSREQVSGEKTQMFSPMEILQAGKVMQSPELARVSTKVDLPVPGSESSGAAAEATKWSALKVDGSPTALFSPVEAVQAAADSRQPFTAQNPPKPPVPPTPQTVAPQVPKTAAPAVSPSLLEQDGQTTVIPASLSSQAETVPLNPALANMARPPQAIPQSPRPEPEERPAAEATKWRALSPVGTATELFSPIEAVQATIDSRQPFTPAVKPAPAPQAASAEGGEGGTEMIPRSAVATLVEQDIDVEHLSEEEAAPIPDVDELLEDSPEPELELNAIPAEVEPPAEAEDNSAPPHDLSAQGDVDLGDDLLEGPTQIFIKPAASDKTANLLRDIRQELKDNPRPERNVSLLLKKAERYIAKRNYYLARKALRHAQALGADEARVKERLRDIRKLEMPESLYSTVSSDRPGKENTDEILSRLEQEFELASGSASQGSTEVAAIVNARIEEIFQDSDPRTILDFGVALHEMGLFRQAEDLYLRLVNEYPEMAFDAYYLAAQAKLGRSDYAGAASILRKLSEYVGKSEIEKIQVYYALGETLEKMQQPGRSRVFFKKVAELDSNYRNIRNKLED